MGSVNLIDVPGFRRLYRCVKNGRFDIVFVDLDEIREGLTPDHESGFVRQNGISQGTSSHAPAIRIVEETFLSARSFNLAGAKHQHVLAASEYRLSLK
jgi:hypothetical protein